ncbi:MAG: hypothetical protein WD847_00695 [Pirellulales bacterium]
MKNDRRFNCFVWSLLVALLAGIVSRFYYALAFLPRHHGSWPEAFVRLIDFEGWLAYVQSPVGLALHTVLLLSLAAAALLLFWRPSKGNDPRGA